MEALLLFTVTLCDNVSAQSNTARISEVAPE